MRNEINLTDAEIEEKIEYYAGCCVEDLVFTRDTLDSFKSASESWNEAKGFEEFDGGVFWDSAQARNGDRRGSLSVFDFGTVRAVYHAGTGIAQ